MEPIILDSARKHVEMNDGHGVADSDMLHAYNQPVFVHTMDEGFTMIVGPRADGQLIEIGVVDSEIGPLIVHAFYPARDQYLR